jgi:uncharacterized membrane protein YphA (DoxX/SURF4 family)
VNSEFQVYRFRRQSLILQMGFVQRLFSTFADGWPGAGLLLLRLLTGAALINFGIGSIREGPPPATVALETVGIAAGIALLVGLFTPVTGALAVIAKIWIFCLRFSAHSDDPWTILVQVTLAATLAMTGPGAWSIDARRFGRKHIDL